MGQVVLCCGVKLGLFSRIALGNFHQFTTVFPIHFHCMQANTSGGFAWSSVLLNSDKVTASINSKDLPVVDLSDFKPHPAHSAQSYAVHSLIKLIH